MFTKLSIVGPEHATTPHPYLPDGDPGDGGTGGAGAGGDGGQQQGGPTGQQGGSTPPAGQQQGGTGGTGTAPTDWQKHARTWESRANESLAEAERLRKENEQLKAAQMSDAEKALAAAKAEGEQAGLAKAAQELVTARLEGALGHLPDEQRDALIDGINPARFLKDGLPDKDAIKAWAERVAPKNATPPPGPGLPMGRRQQPAQPTDMNALIRRAAGVTR